MCGIAGLVLSVGQVCLTDLLAMRDSQAHRGPDDAGVWASPSGKVGLAHRRLSVIDLSPAGHQPMKSNCGQLHIVYNGEIYNYVELREELASLGHRFRSATDTEVVLAAYREWGERSVSLFNGMFAFAIWNEAEQVLFAARDRFGEKPFHYVQSGDRFAFSSEIKALLTLPDLRSEVNADALFRYLAYREVNAGAETLFKGVLALPPAHALRLSLEGKLSIWRYWELEPGDGSLSVEEDTAERFLELFRDAVRIRLRSDVPVGSNLSGGLDSSSIVCAIADITKSIQRQATFSARFEDMQFDEGEYIKPVVEWTGAESYEVYPDPNRLPVEAESLMWHQEEPFTSTSVYAQWDVMRLAKKAGVTVLLDGQGGDESLAGYFRYFGNLFRDLIARFRLVRLFQEVQAYLRVHGSNRLRVVAFGLLPEAVSQGLRRDLRQMGIHPDLDRESFSPFVREERRFSNVVNQALFATLRKGIYHLVRYADRNSMAFSREVRLPFLDHRLVEFLIRLPAEQKIGNGMTKLILRKAMLGKMPEKVRLRTTKLGFTTPEKHWFKQQTLRDWMCELLFSKSLAQRGWLDFQTVRRVATEHWNGRRDWTSLLWQWVCVELWARTFLDPNSR